RLAQVGHGGPRVGRIAPRVDEGAGQRLHRRGSGPERVLVAVEQDLGVRRWSRRRAAGGERLASAGGDEGGGTSRGPGRDRAQERASGDRHWHPPLSARGGARPLLRWAPDGRGLRGTIVPYAAQAEIQQKPDDERGRSG